MGPTLRQALDELGRALPSGVRVDVRRDAVWLTRADAPPERRQRLFDVCDLVEPPDPAAPAGAPPEGVFTPLPAPAPRAR